MTTDSRRVKIGSCTGFAAWNLTLRLIVTDARGGDGGSDERYLHGHLVSNRYCKKANYSSRARRRDLADCGNSGEGRIEAGCHGTAILDPLLQLESGAVNRSIRTRFCISRFTTDDAPRADRNLYGEKDSGSM